MYGLGFIEKFLFPVKGESRNKIEKAISGKTILITGASYGIGEALVRQLSGLPVRLVLVARTGEKLLQLKKELEMDLTEIVCFCADFYDPRQVEALILQLKEQPYSIDILVHNAGKSICRPLEESMEKFHDFTRTMKVNYESPVQLSLSLLPDLIRGKGQIIYVSAVNVLFSSAPCWSAYQASKTALDQWGRAVAAELRTKEVAVSAIYLPLVRTRMIEPTVVYRKAPAMQPDQAAAIIIRAMVKRFHHWSPWWAVFPSSFSSFFPVFWGRISWSSFKKNRS